MAKGFLYTDADDGTVRGGAYVARVPAGIRDPDALFAAIYDALGAPSYAGRNLDALFDVLRDLSWISACRVCLIHADVPELGRTMLPTYIRVLQESMDDWHDGESHELIVVFPRGAQQVVEPLRSTGPFL